jgi:hypothetical protein
MQVNVVLCKFCAAESFFGADSFHLKKKALQFKGIEENTLTELFQSLRMIAIISKKRKLYGKHLNQNQKNIAKKLKKKKAGKFSGAKRENILNKTIEW